MSQVMYGFTITWSGNSQQNLFGTGSINGVSNWLLHVRALNAGIYLGGQDIAGTSSGFELVADEEYEFHLRNVVGSSNDNTPYVIAPGGGSNSLTYLMIPE